jgi:nicotinamide-nucleotide adenylyltransferase
MDDETLRARLYDLPRLLALRRVLRGVVDGQRPAAASAFGAPGAVGRLGLLPGSFNPPTVAHIELATAGLRAGLDTVLFVLSTLTVDKEVVTGAGLEDRLLMVELQAGHDPRLGGLVVNRGLYVEQAELARSTFPNVGEIVFLVGFDKIVQIFDPRYYADRDAALERLFGRARFLVALRGADGPTELAALLDRTENRRFADSVAPLELPASVRDVASSRLRAAIPDDRVLADQLPASRVFAEETGAYEGRSPDGSGVDRYRLRLALLDALEVTGEAAQDFRELFFRALRERP